METTGIQVTLVNLFVAGGIFMWPLLLLSIFGLALSVERTIAVILFNGRTRKLIDFIRNRGTGGSSGFEGLEPAVFRLPPEQADKIIGETVQLSFDRMGRPLELISATGNLAPLIGFLGTVSGMIASFQSIADADKVSVRLVASGISEALITTGAGLIIAVFCIFTEHLVRYYLMSRAHAIEEETAVMTAAATSSPGARESAVSE